VRREVVNVNNWHLSKQKSRDQTFDSVFQKLLRKASLLRMSEEIEWRTGENVFNFKDVKSTFDPFLEYVGDRKEKPEKNVIVMDNGKMAKRIANPLS
jgi:hypothetical protein